MEGGEKGLERRRGEKGGGKGVDVTNGVGVESSDECGERFGGKG